MGVFSYMRGCKTVPGPLGYQKAFEIAGIVKSLRHGIAIARDSDGNVVKVFYPDNVVEDAARAASVALDLPTSVDEIERIFECAEQRISSGVYTS